MLGQDAAHAALDDDATVPPAGDAPGARFRSWRDPVAWAGFSLVLGAYFAISLFKLKRLAPTTNDLAIYTEYVKQLSQLHAPITDALQPGLNFLGIHFPPAVAVIAPFFRLYPSSATLLFFQALFTALSIFPVTGAGAELVGKQAGRVIGLAYGFSWAFQQMIYVEFHELALVVPLLAFSLSALVRGRPRAAIGWAAALVLVKEDQGFTIAAIGIFLVAAALVPGARFFRDRIALWGGVFLTVWGLGWSAVAIWVLIPLFNPAHEYSFWSAGGVIGGGGAFSAGALLRQAAISWPVKLRTTILVLLPTMFTALASPVVLIGLPSLALRFISVNPAYWDTNWDYNAPLMPVVFLAAIDALGRWRRRRDSAPVVPGVSPLPLALGAGWSLARSTAVRYGAAIMAAVAVVIAFKFPLDDLWQGSTYRIGAHVAAADAAMSIVPDGATVTATHDLLAPLSARTDAFWNDGPGGTRTMYLVIDGADATFGQPIGDVPAYVRRTYPDTSYVQVFRRDDVYVFQRQ